MAEERHFIGPYEVLEVIGKGAQASIYRAIYTGEDQPGLVNGQVVALKRMVVDDQYFDRQGDFGVELKHKNIVQYLDHFREDSFEERPCIVMEHLEGYTLEDAINESSSRGGLDWDMVKHIFFQCMEGFVFAYSQGVVHRDVKPSNIFITQEGDVKLIDFGVARRIDGESTVGGFRGTLDYMSPDFVTVSGFTGDEQSDVFSLGICFFESLIGLLPFDKLGANAEFEFMSRWATAPDKNFSITEWVKKHQHTGRVNARKLDHTRTVLTGLSEFLKRCLTADRSKRFTSFAQMQRALGRIDYKRIKSDNYTYQFTDVLGLGGFGRVYKARSSSDYSQEFAVKELLNSKNGLRFKREAELMLRYPHPNIVSCIETIELEVNGDTRMYLVMEYLAGMPGSSLRDRIRQGVKASGGKYAMGVNEALQVFASLLEGLEYLHQNGVLHRDLKPANLYAPQNNPDASKLLDLGIARDAGSTMTKSGAPGTLDYMAPEFATESDFKGSAGSDIYALGLALYEAITGDPAFPRLSRASEPPEVAFYKRASSMPRAELDHAALKNHPQVVQLLRKAIEPNPGKRYRSAAAMLNDINALLSGRASAGPDQETAAPTVAADDLTMVTPAQVASPPPPPPRKAAAATDARHSRKSSTRPPAPAPARPSRSAPAQKSAPPRPNAFQHPVKKKNPVGIFFGILFSLVLVAGLAGGAYYVFMVMPKGPRIDCLATQSTVEEGLVPIESLLRLDEPMLESLVRLRATLHEGVQGCPDVAWSPYLQRLVKPMTAFPIQLQASVVQSILGNDLAQARVQTDLLGKVGVTYGTPSEFGLSAAELADMVKVANESLAYGELLDTLRDRKLATPVVSNIQEVKAANETYQAIRNFNAGDWQQVDPELLKQGDALEPAARAFLTGLSGAFASYLTSLDQQGTQANRDGTGVQGLFQQVKDPELAASPVLKSYPDLARQHEALAATLQIYLNPETRATAVRLTGRLGNPASPMPEVIRDLGEAAALDGSALSDAEKKALDVVVSKAVDRVVVLLDRQKEAVISRYAANDCEGGETEYQKMQSFKDALPKALLDPALKRVEMQLAEARSRCQAYINNLAAFHGKVKTFSSSTWTLKGIDQTIASVGEMANAFAEAETKELDVSRDAQELTGRFTQLLEQARAEKGAGRPVALIKAESLLAGLASRQKDLGRVMPASQLRAQERLLEQELTRHELQVTNGGTVAARIQVKGLAEQSLPAGTSVSLVVPVLRDGEAGALQVVADAPGAVPEMVAFTPSRGGYGEIKVMPRVITDALVNLELPPLEDGAQVVAFLLRAGKNPEPWPTHLRLPPGSYDVRFRRSDYRDIEEAFTVRQAQPSVTVRGPVVTDWKMGSDLQRLLELRQLQRNDPSTFAGLAPAAFNLDLANASYRASLDELRKRWDQSRKNVWEGPISRAEQEVERLREGLFQVSDFGGVDVQGSLRRYEDASEQPVFMRLSVPEFTSSSALPPIMRLRTERLSLWAKALQAGRISSRARASLTSALAALANKVGSDSPELSEALLFDQWVLSGTFRKPPQGEFSTDLRMKANRLIAHTDYMYPVNYDMKVMAVVQYIEGSDAYNHYDALLAIYAAYNYFYHRAIGLPPAVGVRIKADTARAKEIYASNRVLATRLSTCLKGLSVTQVAQIVEHISHDEANRTALFTLLDHLSDRRHPMRNSVIPWLQNASEVAAIRKSLADWQINASSTP